MESQDQAQYFSRPLHTQGPRRNDQEFVFIPNQKHLTYNPLFIHVCESFEKILPHVLSILVAEYALENSQAIHAICVDDQFTCYKCTNEQYVGMTNLMIQFTYTSSKVNRLFVFHEHLIAIELVCYSHQYLSLQGITRNHFGRQLMVLVKDFSLVLDDIMKKLFPQRDPKWLYTLPIESIKGMYIVTKWCDHKDTIERNFGSRACFKSTLESLFSNLVCSWAVTER